MSETRTERTLINVLSTIQMIFFLVLLKGSLTLLRSSSPWEGLNLDQYSQATVLFNFGLALIIILSLFIGAIGLLLRMRWGWWASVIPPLGALYIVIFGGPAEEFGSGNIFIFLLSGSMLFALRQLQPLFWRRT